MSMTPISPTFKLHIHQDKDGIHISSLITKHKGNNYQLYAGTKDTIYIFSESIALYVRTINREHGTIGLNA
jgi:short-subunit dehydrogenase